MLLKLELGRGALEQSSLGRVRCSSRVVEVGPWSPRASARRPIAQPAFGLGTGFLQVLLASLVVSSESATPAAVDADIISSSTI